MQDNNAPRRANNSMNVFGEWVISQGEWPAHSPKFKSLWLLFTGHAKNNIYMNNSHSL